MKMKTFCLVLLVPVFLVTSLNSYAGQFSALSVESVKISGINDDSRLEILEEIMREVTYKNHKKWMKKKGFKYSESHSSDGISSFEMDYSSEGIKLYFVDEKLCIAVYYFTPSNFYRTEKEITDLGFSKSTETKKKNKSGVEVKLIQWTKSGSDYSYYSDHSDTSIYCAVGEYVLD